MWLARRWWLIPVAIIITGGSLGANFGPEGSFDASTLARGLAAACAATAAISLFVMDRRPVTIVIVGALSGGYFALGGENGPIFFALIVASFLLATRQPVRAWFPLLLLAAALLWLGLLIRGLRWDELIVGTWQSIGVGALVAAATAIGSSFRQGHAARAERVERGAAEERLRMAQDLHDGVGHGLAVIAMQAGVALHVLDRDPAKARESLEAIRSTSREALDSLRAELATMAGEPAPRRPAPGLEGIAGLVDRVRAAGLQVDVVGEPGEVAEPVGVTAHAVVQEALTNVLRHAAAQTVTLTWNRAPGLLLVAVTDDGQGGSVQDGGMGITGMRSRVAAVGGTLRVGPRPQGGFEVVAELPL